MFKAFTDPELYVQWVGPRGFEMKLEIFEPRKGGSWRYIHKDADGNEYAFHGVNSEVSPPERIIGTFEFEGLPEKGHVALETASFETLPGNRTKLRAQSVSSRLKIGMGCCKAGWKKELMIPNPDSMGYWKNSKNKK